MLKHFVLDDRKCVYKIYFKQANFKDKVYNYYDHLIKVKKLETKNILINKKKSYKSLIIYFVRYNHKKSTSMLISYCHKLM